MRIYRVELKNRAYPDQGYFPSIVKAPNAGAAERIALKAIRRQKFRIGRAHIYASRIELIGWPVNK